MATITSGHPVDWAAVAAIAATVYTIVFTGSIVFLWLQIREIRRSRDGEIMMRLYDRIVASREKRMRIYDNETTLKHVKDLASWDDLRRNDPDLATAVLDVSMDYHLLGLFLSSTLLAQQNVFLSDIGEVFLRLFGIIRPLIVLERQRSGRTYRATLEKLEGMVRAALKQDTM
jgi:hypothetical protein